MPRKCASRRPAAPRTLPGSAWHAMRGRRYAAPLRMKSTSCRPADDKIRLAPRPIQSTEPARPNNRPRADSTAETASWIPDPAIRPSGLIRRSGSLMSRRAPDHRTRIGAVLQPIAAAGLVGCTSRAVKPDDYFALVGALGAVQRKAHNAADNCCFGGSWHGFAPFLH
jgi:hypothetical protein